MRRWGECRRAAVKGVIRSVLKSSAREQSRMVMAAAGGQPLHSATNAGLPSRAHFVVRSFVLALFAGPVHSLKEEGGRRKGLRTYRPTAGGHCDRACNDQWLGLLLLPSLAPPRRTTLPLKGILALD